MEIIFNRHRFTPGQWSLLQSNSWASLISGGFGSGKTTAASLKTIRLKTVNGRVPGLLAAPSWKVLWAVTYRNLWKTLRATIPIQIADKWMRVHDKVGECFLDWGDGVPIYLRSAKNPDSIDGLDVGWGVGDEIRHWPRHSFEVFLARVRVPCPANQRIFASTPRVGWMSDEFNSGKEGRDLIIAPTKENAHNLSPGFIDNLRLSYSPRLQKAIIDGFFVPLEGAVYEAVDPDIWKSQWCVDHEYDPSLKTYLAIDPGYRRSSWLFVQETKRDEWVVFDELMPDSTSDFVCVDRVNQLGYGIDEIWVDPAADATQSTMGQDTLDMLRKIKARNRSPVRHIAGPFREIAYGVDKVRTLLGDPDRNIKPRLKFARRLERIERHKQRGIVKDLLAYTYPEMRDGRPVSDQPLKDGITDHSNDALRYLVVGLWLTTGLRKIDPRLAQERNPGYKVAA